MYLVSCPANSCMKRNRWIRAQGKAQTSAIVCATPGSLGGGGGPRGPHPEPPGVCAAEGTSAATREKPVSHGTASCAQGPAPGFSASPRDPRFSQVSLRCLLPRSLPGCATQPWGEGAVSQASCLRDRTPGRRHRTTRACASEGVICRAEKVVHRSRWDLAGPRIHIGHHVPRSTVPCRVPRWHGGASRSDQPLAKCRLVPSSLDQDRAVFLPLAMRIIDVLLLRFGLPVQPSAISARIRDPQEEVFATGCGWSSWSRVGRAKVFRCA
jgi:hypothetical protein